MQNDVKLKFLYRYQDIQTRKTAAKPATTNESDIEKENKTLHKEARKLRKAKQKSKTKMHIYV